MTKQEIDNLITENHNLIYFCLNKWKMPIDEFYDVAAIGLCKAAQTYDSTRTKFSTYACTCIYNELKQTLRFERACMRVQQEHCISLDNPVSNNPDTDVTVIDMLTTQDSTEVSVLSQLAIQNIFELLDNRDRLIITLRVLGYDQSEIAPYVGIHQASVSRKLAKIRKRLQKLNLR